MSDIFAGFDVKPEENDIFAGFPVEDPERAARTAAQIKGSLGGDPAKAAYAVEESRKSGLPPEVIAADPAGYKVERNQKKNADIIGRSKVIQGFVNNSQSAAEVFFDEMQTLEEVQKNAERVKDYAGAAFRSAKEMAKPPEQATFEYTTKFLNLERQAERHPYVAAALWYSPWVMALRAPTIAMQAFGAVQGAVTGLIGETVRQITGDDNYAERLTAQLNEDLPVMLMDLGVGRQVPKVTLPRIVPDYLMVTPEELVKGRDDFQKGKWRADLEGKYKGMYEGLVPRTEWEGDSSLGPSEYPPSRGQVIVRPFVGAEGEEGHPTIETNGKVSDAAVASAAMGETPHAGLDPHVDFIHALQAQVDANALDKLYETIQGSEGAKASPEAMAEYLQYLLPYQKIYIPSDVINELYDGRVVDGTGPLSYVQGLEDKLAMGTDVAVPLSQFLVHTEPGAFEALRDRVRMREAGLAPSEYEELVERRAEETAKAEEPPTFDPEKSIPDSITQYVDAIREVPEPEALEVPHDVTGFEAAEETRKAKPGANIARIAQLLGTQLYGSWKNMPQVVVKEILQNSFDAIKGVIAKMPEHQGRIEFTVDDKSRTISVLDNGTGMTPDVLGKQFLEIAGTVKETEQASGGLGIAKMMFLFGNQEIEVRTMRDGKVSSFKTTGPELFEALQDPEKAPNITIEDPKASDHMNFPEGHGTRVTVKVPESYKDTSTGEMTDIEFPRWRGDYEVLRRSPLFANIDVKWNGYALDNMGTTFDKDAFTQFANVKFDWGTARIYVSKEKDLAWRENAHILSNGLWQFSNDIPKNPNAPYGGNVERKFYIDASPRVKPEQPGYPFTLNRQGFTKQAMTDFAKIYNYISVLYNQEDFSASAQNFGAVQYLDYDKIKGNVVPSKPEKLEPPIKKRETALTGIKQGDKVEVKEGKLIVNGRQIPELKPEDLDKVKLQFDELIIPQDKIYPNRPMLHDNLEVTDPSSPEERGPIGTLARARFGVRFDHYMYEIGSAFIKLRNEVALLLDYPELKREAIGISFDEEYRGVSIRVPFSGSFLNPAATEFRDTPRAAYGMYYTMIHELAHHKVRSHDASFPAEMQRIMLHLETGNWDYVTAKGDFFTIVNLYGDIHQWLWDALRSGDPKAIGKRFKDGSYEGRDGGGPEDMAPAREGTEEGPRVPPGAAKGTGTPGEVGGPPSVPTGAEESVEAAVRKELYLEPLFKTEKAVGITKAEFARYSKAIEKLDRDSFEKLLERARKRAKRELTPEWRQNKAEIQQQVITDLNSRGDIAVDNYLRNGVLPTGEEVTAPKLDRASVEAALGKGALSKLTAEKGGITPDDLAMQLGYGTGAELLQDLKKLQDDRGTDGPKTYFNKLVNEETNRRMQEKYGVLEDNILERAREDALASHNMDLLDADYKMLARVAGVEPPYTREALEASAKERFEKLPAEDATYESFRRAAERAGRDSERGLQKGKWDESLRAKERHIIAFLGARMAKDFERFKAKAEKQFDKFVKAAPKAIDAQYALHIQQVLNRVGYTERVFPMPSMSMTDLAIQSYGSVAVAPWLIDQGTMRQGLTYENMTVDEFRSLAKSIQSLDHVGRDLKKVMKGQEKVDLDNAVTSMVWKLERFDPIKGLPEGTGRKFSMKRFVTAPFMLVERILDYSDKFDPQGPFSTFIDRPIRNALNTEIKMNEQVTRRLREIEKLVDNTITDKIENPFIVNPLTGQLMEMDRQNLRHLILHMGSKSGVEKVTQGFNISLAQARSIIRMNATKADFDWAEKVWDMFHEIWEASAPMQERVSGVPADPLEPNQIMMTLQDGTQVNVQGGYTSVIYDKDLSTIKEDLLRRGDLFDEHYYTATTPQAYTIKRTGYAGFLDLSGDLLASRIKQMVHDVAFREAVIDVKKVISHPEFMRNVRKYWGPEYADQLQGWLKDIANFHSVDDTFARGWQKASAEMRRNIVSTLVAFNPSTVIKHGLTALSMSIAQVGLKGFGKGVYDVGFHGMYQEAVEMMKMDKKPPELTQDFLDGLRILAAPTQAGADARAFMMESSPFMRDRYRQWWDTIQGAYGRANDVRTLEAFWRGRERAMAIGRLPIALSDFFSAGSMWLSAYKDSMARTGDHADAVFEADRKVARAHGSNFIGDKPAALRSKNEATRWLTPLYMFWNHMLNNQMQLMWDIGAFAKGKDEPGATVSSISSRILLYSVIPIIAEEIATAPLDEEKGHKGLLSRAMLAGIRFFGSMIPGLREVTNFLAAGHEPSVGLFTPMLHNFTQIANDAARFGVKHTISKDFLTHLSTALGFATGIGGTQVGRTMTGFAGMMSGRERPRNLTDFRQLMRTGHTRVRRY